MTIARSDRSFVIAAVLAFTASAAVTIAWCRSMSGMGSMRMPGDWTLSMAWMRMPGQTWTDAAAAFIGMWAVMMAAMMLPSLAPALQRYRRSVNAVSNLQFDALTAIVAASYFFVWILLGVAVFPLGVALAALALQSDALARVVPPAIGLVVLGAGALQFTAWKAHHLACCRAPRQRDVVMPADADTAWRHGLRLGWHCCSCCAGLTAILLVMGAMDLGTMALVSAAITAERLAPAGVHVARGIGAVSVLAGLLLVVHAASV